MAIPVHIELTIMVANEEQATKILEAVYSGEIETTIKDRIIYGHSGVGSGVQTKRSSLEGIELKRATEEITKDSIRAVKDGEKEKKTSTSRKRGVFGRSKPKRIGER